MNPLTCRSHANTVPEWLTIPAVTRQRHMASRHPRVIVETPRLRYCREDAVRCILAARTCWTSWESNRGHSTAFAPRVGAAVFIPEDARSSPSEPEEHFQGCNFSFSRRVSADLILKRSLNAYVFINILWHIILFDVAIQLHLSFFSLLKFVYLLFRLSWNDFNINLFLKNNHLTILPQNWARFDDFSSLKCNRETLVVAPDVAFPSEGNI